MNEEYKVKFMYNRDTYKIIIDYFCNILNENFMMALVYMSEGANYSIKYSGIEIGYDIKKKNSIIKFYDFENEIYISKSIFANSLYLACQIYIENNLDSKNEIIRLFKLIYDRLI